MEKHLWLKSISYNQKSKLVTPNYPIYKKIVVKIIRWNKLLADS